MGLTEMIVFVLIGFALALAVWWAVVRLRS
jgi:hypothetical protein